MQSVLVTQDAALKLSFFPLLGEAMTRQRAPFQTSASVPLAPSVVSWYQLPTARQNAAPRQDRPLTVVTASVPEGAGSSMPSHLLPFQAPPSVPNQASGKSGPSPTAMQFFFDPHDS